MRNGDVTRYVTGGVTVPRPDPTRPDPSIGLRCIAWPQVVSDSSSRGRRLASCNAEKTSTSSRSEWCLVCAAQIWDNSCGHFGGWR